MGVRRKLMLKCLITKVVKGLAFLSHIREAYPAISNIDIDDEEEEGAIATTTWVPEDVREGHFAVIAMEGEEKKRFIIELEYLKDPDFLRLLEEAKEEYGFGQSGALAVPCTPHQLQNIIEKNKKKSLKIESH